MRETTLWGEGVCLGEEGWRTGGQYWTFKYDTHFDRSVDRLMFESGVGAEVVLRICLTTRCFKADI